MNKKGISETVAYVLLVVIAISLSLVVFAWLKGYIIQPEKNCPDGISFSMEYACKEKLELTLKNTGLFDVDGFILKYSNDEKPPAIMLSSPDGDYFSPILKPGMRQGFAYDYSTITSIEFLPIKIMDSVPVICTNARFRQNLNSCSI